MRSPNPEFFRGLGASTWDVVCWGGRRHDQGPNHCKNGRQFAAWVGLVPRQHSTGGKPACSGSVNGAISICGPSWCMGHARHSAGWGSRRIAGASGAAPSWNGGGRTRPRWRSPIKMRGWCGRCSRPIRCTPPSMRQHKKPKYKGWRDFPHDARGVSAVMTGEVRPASPDSGVGQVCEGR